MRYDVLEMIERYEDRVDLIVGVLAGLQHLDARVPDRGRRQAVTYNLKPESGEGRSTANPPIDAAGEVWRRVDIRATEREGDATVRLEFTSIGRLARAERILGDVERAIVDRLVATAINDPNDEAVGGALFELVIPQELKGELGSGENLQLLVGPQEADLPWELLRPRPEDYEQQVPLALRVGLLRQFRESDELRFGARRRVGEQRPRDRQPAVRGPPVARRRGGRGARGRQPVLPATGLRPDEGPERRAMERPLDHLARRGRGGPGRHRRPHCGPRTPSTPCSTATGGSSTSPPTGSSPTRPPPPVWCWDRFT